MNRAAAAHIPVVIYDSDLDSENYSTFVATDNHLGGAMGADQLGHLLNGKGKVVMIKTVPGGASTTAREDGFKEELKAKFPGVEILDERYGMASIAVSLQVTENMLTAHPDLNGIFASNESGTAGASQALKATGGSIKLVGFDSSPMLVEQLRAGVINSLVIQDPFRMGQTAVDVEITAAANAVAGDKADVNVQGTATAAGNQTAATAKNPLFPLILRTLAGYVKFVQRESCYGDAVRVQRAVQSHESILEAIRWKDAERARVEMEAHLRYSSSRILRSRDSSGPAGGGSASWLNRSRRRRSMNRRRPTPATRRRISPSARCSSSSPGSWGR